MHLKNERIKKLWNNGCKDPEKIARKLGLVSSERVIEGLKVLAERGEVSFEANS